MSPLLMSLDGFDVSLGFGGSPRGINARGYIVGDYSDGLHGHGFLGTK